MTTTSINSLIEKASSAHNSNDALKFSQAALNVANALARDELTRLFEKSDLPVQGPVPY